MQRLKLFQLLHLRQRDAVELLIFSFIFQVLFQIDNLRVVVTWRRQALLRLDIVLGQEVPLLLVFPLVESLKFLAGCWLRIIQEDLIFLKVKRL